MSARMTNERRRSPGVFIGVFILLMGAAALMNFASVPGFGTFRAIDVVRLMAAGMCFGSGIAVLVMSLARPR